MKKALTTFIQYVVFLGLGIWIIYHMLHQLTDAQTNELIAAIKSINVWYLIPIFFVGFLSHFFRAIRWKYLLETVDLKPSVVNMTFAVLIGYIANLALPRAGEVAKCTVLAKYENMPAHKMIGTIVAERAFDLFSLVIITCLAFALQAHTINEYLSEGITKISGDIARHRNILIAGIIVLVIAIVLLVRLYRKHSETKVGRFVNEMLRGIMSIFHMKRRWAFMGYTVLIWAMYLLQLYIGFRSLPATAHLTPLAALVVLVYGSVGMIVTPGGIGLYPFLVAQILGAYMIAEVPGQAFGWIAWVVQTGVIVVLGVISLLVIHPYNRKRNGQAAVGTTENIQP